MGVHQGRIRRAELAERLRHFNMSTFHSTSDLLAAGVVALAAGVALDIVVEPGALATKGPAWVASLLLFVMIHAFWRFGGLMVSWRSDVGDQIFPLLLGLMEFGQFIVLSRQFGGGPWQTIWLCLIAGQFVAGALFLNGRLAHALAPDQYDADVEDFASAYAAWVRGGRQGLAIGAALASLLALADDLAMGFGRAALAGWLALGTAALATIFAARGLYGFAGAQDRFQSLLFAGTGPADRSGPVRSP